MSKWIEESEHRGECARCREGIGKGQRIYWVRRGVVMCELCGSLAEHEVPETGAIERGVLTDLGTLADEASETALAQTTLYMARALDRNEVAPRDVAPYNKEMRQNITALKDTYAETGDDDATDLSRSKRDKFLGATYEEPYTP
jgi:hypothetical protein